MLKEATLAQGSPQNWILACNNLEITCLFIFGTRGLPESIKMAPKMASKTQVITQHISFRNLLLAPFWDPFIVSLSTCLLQIGPKHGSRNSPKHNNKSVHLLNIFFPSLGAHQLPCWAILRAILTILGKPSGSKTSKHLWSFEFFRWWRFSWFSNSGSLSWGILPHLNPILAPNGPQNCPPNYPKMGSKIKPESYQKQWPEQEQKFSNFCSILAPKSNG